MLLTTQRGAFYEYGFNIRGYVFNGPIKQIALMRRISFDCYRSTSLCKFRAVMSVGFESFQPSAKNLQGVEMVVGTRPALMCMNQ